MDTCHLLVGCTYIMLICFSTPLYLRIIYVFIKNPNYRHSECYQIMIQLGIVQCLMGPGWLFTGLASILTYDFKQIGSWLVILTSASLRMETGLSFVLAVNRVKTVCKVNCPELVIKAISAAIWIFGVSLLICLCSPMAGMYADPVTMSPKYNYTYSYTFYIQQTVFVYTLVFSLLTLVLYAALVVYLIRQSKEITHSSASYKEKWIFAQAIIRFLADVTLNFTFHLGPTLAVLPQWMMISIMIGYIIDHLVVPPLLYVTLNRQLRNEIFLLKKTAHAVFNSGMIWKLNLTRK